MSTEIEYVDQNDPAAVLSVAQRSSTVLAKSSLVTKSLPISLVTALEAPIEWAELEQIFYACLRSGDDEAAHRCLERLTGRFGDTNHRVMALRGMYQEAVAQDELELRRVLQTYNDILKQDPMNVPMHKRRTALIRALGRPVDAIECLVHFLNSFPTDTESWCELADLYLEQNLHRQAIFCLEEAILVQPNAWNLHARLGELNYVASQVSSDGMTATHKSLTEAVRRFSRSVELCQHYLRGYYGLLLTTTTLLHMEEGQDAPEVARVVVKQLNQVATKKLKLIIAMSSNSTGPRQAEVIAAQALLDTGPV